MSETAMNLVAPLFIEAGDFTSRITMVNELNFAITADVVLYDHNGSQIISQPIAFPAHSQQALLVRDLLLKAKSAENFGSVEIRPDPGTVATMAIAGQISITGAAGNIGQHIEEEFLMIGAQGSGVQRSAGTSLAGHPVIALKNTATTPQTATMSCIAEKGG